MKECIIVKSFLGGDLRQDSGAARVEMGRLGPGMLRTTVLNETKLILEGIEPRVQE